MPLQLLDILVGVQQHEAFFDATDTLAQTDEGCFEKQSGNIQQTAKHLDGESDDALESAWLMTDPSTKIDRMPTRGQNGRGGAATLRTAAYG